MVQRLESLHRAGVRQLPKVAVAPPAEAEPPPAATPAPVETHEAPHAIDARHNLFEEDLKMSRKASTTRDERIEALSALDAEVKQCTQCFELASTRTQTVFGVGNPQARIVFFGEAPGADEDRQGEPFVGRAGKLLDKIIEACSFRRQDVYIMNVLKCRPPNNADPVAEQVEACRHFLMAQLVILRPKVIVTLGRHSLNLLISPDLRITKIRGQHIKKNGQLYLPTYHPAMILRNPRLEPEFRHDLAKAKALSERT